MKKNDSYFILSSFVFWRLSLFFFLYLAIKLIPLGEHFLGGGKQNYLSFTWLWAWLNFDGEHLLSVAQWGYKPLQYFYFPLFPLLTRTLAGLFSKSLISFAVSGLLVSNVSFLLALIGFWQLVCLDWDKKIARLSLLLLLFFPASLFLGSFYTESLFLALVAWSFYFARKGKWFWAGVFGGLAGATRVVGVLLLPCLLAEYLLVKENKRKILTVLGITILSSLGVIAYMSFLQARTGDPLNFFHTVAIFGEQRSANIILLPQVFFRYFFRVLPNLSLSYFPAVFTTLFEIITAVIFFGLAVWSFFKLRLSYALYLLGGYMIPTLSGSFSSLPRYVLVLFPAFILLAVLINKLPKVLQVLLFSLLLISLGIATAMFTRGLWVA